MPLADCTEIRVGDINIHILVDIKEDGQSVDISGGIVEFKMKKPSGAILSNSATFLTDGTDGLVYYNSASGDFDEEGSWKLQAIVTLGSGYYQSRITNFEVYGNL